MAIAIQDQTQRIVLSGVQWVTYDQLLKDRGDRHNVYFTYDQGLLELMTPSFSHEHINRVLAMIVEAAALALQVDLYPAGSTTFTREDLSRGFEPDSCYYVTHAAAVRGKRTIDLATDPPPDLVVEIDVTSSSIDKLSLYEAIGVPEVWRYVADGLAILCLTPDGGYRTEQASPLFPALTTDRIMGWVDDYDNMIYPAWADFVRQELLRQ